MKILLNVTLGEIGTNVNRQVMIDEMITLDDLCEFIIISMNGKKMPIYELEYKDYVYYPGDYDIDEYKYERCLRGLFLKDLNLEKKSNFTIKYNFDYGYYFNVAVDDIIDNNDDNKDVYFEVLSGMGNEIIDDLVYFDLEHLMKNKRFRENCLKLKKFKDYFDYKFDINQINDNVINI